MRKYSRKGQGWVDSRRNTLAAWRSVATRHRGTRGFRRASWGSMLPSVGPDYRFRHAIRAQCLETHCKGSDQFVQRLIDVLSSIREPYRYQYAKSARRMSVLRLCLHTRYESASPTGHASGLTQSPPRWPMSSSRLGSCSHSSSSERWQLQVAVLARRCQERRNHLGVSERFSRR